MVIIESWLLVGFIYSLLQKKYPVIAFTGSGPLPLPYPWYTTDSSIKVAEGLKLTSSWYARNDWELTVVTPVLLNTLFICKEG